jgi:hypothetical protein
MSHTPFSEGAIYPFGPSAGSSGSPIVRVTSDEAFISSPLSVYTCLVSASVDLTVVGNTSLVTTPTDRGYFFPFAVFLSPDTSTVSPLSVSLGYTAPNYSDWISSLNLGGSLLAHVVYIMSLKTDAAGAAPTGRLAAPPSSTITLRVVTASNSGTGRFGVWGVYTG